MAVEGWSSPSSRLQISSAVSNTGCAFSIFPLFAEVARQIVVDCGGVRVVLSMQAAVRRQRSAPAAAGPGCTRPGAEVQRHVVAAGRGGGVVLGEHPQADFHALLEERLGFGVDLPWALRFRPRLFWSLRPCWGDPRRPGGGGSPVPSRAVAEPGRELPCSLRLNARLLQLEAVSRSLSR